ncbi:MAG: flagellar basal-body rod protein FlgF [bacterium]
MLRGLYTSASGMVNDQRRMDVISNNLANSTTTGFKEIYHTQKSYPENDMVRTDDQTTELPMGTIDKRPEIGPMSTGVASDGTFVNWSPGSFESTENHLDMAIEGEGLFAVQLEDGEEVYTRNGNFKLNSDREIVAQGGAPVMGEDGPIQLPESAEEIHVIETGRIVDQDNNVIGDIKIRGFDNPQQLRKMGKNFYRQGEATAQEVPIENYNVHQGMLEKSNVDPINSMMNMIEVNRSHELSSKMIQKQSSVLGKAISRVGRA